MNSLEWINAEIIKWQEILNDFKKQLIEVKGTRNEQTTLNHIECYELKLKYLQQIKEELEAWYVLKPDLEHTENSLGEHEIELRVFYTDADVEQDDTKEKYYTLKKALEI